jgi:membrane fusion protein, multidrug efflux system
MLKKLLITPGVILGVLSFFYLAQTKEKPQRTPITERAKPVRAIPIPQVSLIPRALGFGYVKPEKVWKAIAEVGGKIVEIHPNLKKGVFLNKGEILFQIKPEQSQFAVEQTKADILNIKAQIAELDQNQINTQRQLEIEEKSLEINQKELKRKDELFSEGVISRSELDKEKQRLLVQKNVAENYKGILNRIPSEQRALAATLSASQSRLGEAQINLGKTIIRVPFSSRVSEVNVELGQAANVGQTLATTDSVEVSEIEA